MSENWLIKIGAFFAGIIKADTAKFEKQIYLEAPKAGDFVGFIVKSGNLWRLCLIYGDIFKAFINQRFRWAPFKDRVKTVIFFASCFGIKRSLIDQHKLTIRTKNIIIRTTIICNDAISIICVNHFFVFPS